MTERTTTTGGVTLCLCGATRTSDTCPCGATSDEVQRANRRCTGLCWHCDNFLTGETARQVTAAKEALHALEECRRPDVAAEYRAAFGLPPTWGGR